MQEQGILREWSRTQRRSQMGGVRIHMKNANVTFTNAYVAEYYWSSAGIQRKADGLTSMDHSYLRCKAKQPQATHHIGPWWR